MNTNVPSAEKFGSKYFDRRKYENSSHNDGYFLFLERYIKDLKSKKILDIGCALGLFLKNNCNDESAGVDVSRYVLRRAKGNVHGKRLFPVDLNREEMPIGDRFDVITMFDVVEHLDNYIYLKGILENNLKEGGVFVVTTPNANSLLRLFSRSRFTGEIDETHTILFTPYTLDFFLRRSGFTRMSLFTPYSFYNKENLLTNTFLFGGQIFAVYKKL